MATKMTKAEDTATTTAGVKKAASNDNDVLKKQNEDLMETIRLLQEQINSLKATQGVTKTIELTSKMDRPCSIIHLIDCAEGLPTNININGNEYYFSRFGEKKLFRFADAQNIVTKYADWFSRGILTLGEDCDEFKNEFAIPPRRCDTLAVYNRLADMPLDEFKTLVENLAQCDKVQLARNFMVKISRGETKYNNVDKLRVLNKATDGLLKDYIKEINNDE